jgi:ABC-type Mn2+/Zn2+ transport system permease subunit
VIDWIADPLGETFFVRALAELLLIGVLSGTLGCWVVLRGMSYSAESLAHGMLPGLVLAALAGVPLALGGAAGLAAAAVAIALVGRVPRLDQDVAVSVVVTAMVGLGGLLALSPDTPAGLAELLFGDVLGVTDGDLVLSCAAVVVTLAVLAALHAGLTACVFDPQGAPLLGRSPAAHDTALALLLALATLVAVQALGSLLVVAMLVGPAATAGLVCHRIPAMMGVSIAVAAGAAVAGMYASYHARTGASASVTAAVAVTYALVLAARTALVALHAPRTPIPAAEATA